MCEVRRGERSERGEIQVSQQLGCTAPTLSHISALLPDFSHTAMREKIWGNLPSPLSPPSLPPIFLSPFSFPPPTPLPSTPLLSTPLPSSPHPSLPSSSNTCGSVVSTSPTVWAQSLYNGSKMNSTKLRWVSGPRALRVNVRLRR